MNAHQRRQQSRRNHMALPLGKAVRLASLAGRRVYSYRLAEFVVLDSDIMTRIASATVHRHIRQWNSADVLLEDHDGNESAIRVGVRGLRLARDSDRAPWPWWSETRIKARARSDREVSNG